MNEHEPVLDLPAQQEQASVSEHWIRHSPVDTIRRYCQSRLHRDQGIEQSLMSWLQTDPRKSVVQLSISLTRKLQAIEKQVVRTQKKAAFDKAQLVSQNNDGLLAGIDEAGAGPLAGPVVAASVMFGKHDLIVGIDDSKTLSEARREDLADTIQRRCLSFGIGMCSHLEIDNLNIYRACLLAMRRAFEAMLRASGSTTKPEMALVDARTIPNLSTPQVAIKKGDSHSYAIGAASILAKVTRDQMMEKYAEQFPGYGFEKHRGYGTQMHLDALRILGPSPIHRKSFEPVKKLSSRKNQGASLNSS